MEVQDALAAAGAMDGDIALAGDQTAETLGVDLEDVDVPDDHPGSPRMGVPRAPGGPGAESRIVEVQFRAGAQGIATALAEDAQAFVEGAAAGGTIAGGLAVQTVLANRGLERGRFSFDPGHLAAETERLAAVAAAGDAAAEPFAGLPPLHSFVQLQFSTPDFAAIAARELQALPEVELAVLVPGSSPPSVPADPLIGTEQMGVKAPPGKAQPQWYLHRTGVVDAWRLGALGDRVVIADIDWGYRVTHQELAGRLELKHAYNAYNRDRNVSVGPSTRHGTAVLGLAGAAADGRGMAGYAPRAGLWPIQGNGGSGAASEAAWHDAIEHVRKADSGGRRKVIILEVQTDPEGGNYEQMPSVNGAIQRAIADGVVVCVAAGNGGRPADLSDAGKPIPPTGSILVGATLWDPTENRRARFSNWGSRVVVSAPGDTRCDVTCTDAGDDKYSNKFGGTSGATAKVAGVAALMLSVNPALTHHDVREILRGTGTPITPHPSAPHRRIGVFLNAEAAVREALRRAGANAAGAAAAPARVRIEGLARQAPPSRRRGTGAASPPDAIPDAPAFPDRTLREFRRSTEGVMTREQQLLAVDQAIHLLDAFYVHRLLKEAMHAVRPVQRLRVLRRRLEEEPDAWTGRRELRLHNLLSDVFLSVRDLHTSYLLPYPYRDYTAFLPFLVRPYTDDEGRGRYVVTRVLPGFEFSHPDFGRGAEILFWNGADIEAAVEMNAQQTAGSNPAARHVRGVDALTLRPMNVALPPEADWVHVTFRLGDDEPPQEMRQDWLVRFTPVEEAAAAGNVAPLRLGAGMNGAAAPDGDGHAAGATNAARGGAAPRIIHEQAAFRIDPTRVASSTTRDLVFFPVEPVGDPAPAPAGAVLAGAAPDGAPDPRFLEYEASLGIDMASDAVREVKQLLFTPDTVIAADERARSGTADARPVEGEDVLTHLPLVFYARRLDLGGRERAYLRIRTFKTHDPDAFVNEFIRLLELLPQDGLLLDVRGNGGGHIFAAERLLQTLTPGRIEPERLQFVSTAGTLELCRRSATSPNLSSWTPSLEQAVLTGSAYSRAFPLTDPASCNDIGQRYHGPVVLLVDARCYSATDIFAAGFEDHEIGVIVGTNPTTGAGGANVWSHDLLQRLYSGDGAPLQPLPHGMGMRVAIRQALRVGPRAGTLLEDFGVSPAPDHVHRTTRRDLLKDDVDLLEFAAGILDARPVYRLALRETGRAGEQVRFEVEAEGIGRLDFYLDEQPAGSVSCEPGGPLPGFSVRTGIRVELRGFASTSKAGDARPVAALKHTVA
ncbi:MAG TPA: S8 family serine peptidase [Longimicrobium sp.]|nr:S8 family serine peptidase [Longimicrobium sp.]